MKKPAQNVRNNVATTPPLHSQRLTVLAAAFIAMLIAAGMVWLLRSQLPAVAKLFPVERVVFVSATNQPLVEVSDDTLKQIADALETRQASMLQLDLVSLKAGMIQLEWVRDANVRRQFPSTIVVAIEEHKPKAAWLGEAAIAKTNDESVNDSAALVNQFGEVFRAVLTDERRLALPKLSGPEGTSTEVLEKFASVIAPLAVIARSPATLTLTPRRAWQLTLDNGANLELGRHDTEVRLNRFIATYPQIAALQVANSQVDLRYLSGFTIRNVATATSTASATSAAAKKNL
jgi:cell division protein FtsQ